MTSQVSTEVFVLTRPRKDGLLALEKAYDRIFLTQEDAEETRKDLRRVMPEQVFEVRRVYVFDANAHDAPADKAPTHMRLTSNAGAYAPGLANACATAWAAGDTDYAFALCQGWPDLPIWALERLLSGKYAVDGDAVIITHDSSVAPLSVFRLAPPKKVGRKR